MIRCLGLLINFNNMLGAIDFRNARYQGEIENQLPHGLGIVIDQSLLFCLATWYKGTINGPVFAVYPDHKIFCGYARNNRLSHLSCFYLPEYIQTYINYTQKQQHNNFLTLLPAFKLILEIDCNHAKGPKAIRHINYEENKQYQDQQLNKAFGRKYELQEYRSWKSFLKLNFLQKYQHRLFWNQSIQSKYYQFFLGLKNRGLGIKMLQIYEGEETKQKIKTPIIVSSIGQFSTQHQLRGYGQQLIDFTLFKRVEQGEFFEKVKDIIEYSSSKRPNQAFKLFNIYQQKSIHFRNNFIDLSLLFKLQEAYSKIDVEVVEETKKIAQVILHNKEDSQQVVAQIEKKRQKRKKSILDKGNTQKSIIENSRLKLSGATSNDIISPIRLANPEIKLDVAQKSIYSSAEKIKKQNPHKIHKVFEDYKKLYTDETDETSNQNHKRPFRPIVSRVNVSPSPRNGIHQQRSKYNQQTINSRLQQSPLKRTRKENSFTYLQNKNDIRQAELALYRKIKGRNELKYQDLQSSFYRKQQNDSYKYYSPSKQQAQLQDWLIPYRRSPYQLSSNGLYSRQLQSPDYSSKNQRENKSPLYKTLLKDQDYSIYYEKIKDKQQQLQFYNKALRESREKGYMRAYEQRYSPPKAPFGSRSRSRVKTPGKIRTIKRQKQLQA